MTKLPLIYCCAPWAMIATAIFMLQMTGSSGEPTTQATITPILNPAGVQGPQLVGNLLVLYTHYGAVNTTAYAAGSAEVDSYPITVLKPTASASLFRADLMCCSNYLNFKNRIKDAELRMNNVPITWDRYAVMSNSGGKRWSHQAEVTSLLKASLDGAGLEPTLVQIVEPHIEGVDGCAIVATWEDASFSDVTAIVQFGAPENIFYVPFPNYPPRIHSIASQFYLHAYPPLDLTTPGFTATLGLGIGFSHYNPNDSGEIESHNQVRVNGATLTSFCGGCRDSLDDYGCANGNLIAVGGWGDKAGDQEEQSADGPGPDLDDSFYDMTPYLYTRTSSVRTAAQTFNIATNIYNFDIIFLSYVMITAHATITFENCCDSIDNNGNGLVDMADPECAPYVGVPLCAPPSTA